MSAGIGGASRTVRPETEARKSALLAGEPAEASSLEFSVRELVFLAGCAEFSGYTKSLLIVRDAEVLSADEWRSLLMIGGAHVRFRAG